MRYSEIKDLLFCADVCDLLFEGMHYTEPFFIKCDHGIGDVFWLYDRDGEVAVIYGGIAVDPDTQQRLQVITDVELVLPAFRMPDTDMEEYERLYEQLHEFAFADVISGEQTVLVERFLQLLHREKFAYVKIIYLNLCPEFLSWAGSKIK